MQAVKPTEFGLAQHRIQQFSVTMPTGMTNEMLTDPALWVNVAPQCRMNDMIWVDAEDLSYTALLKVTYTAGQKMRVKLIFRAEMDVVDHDAEDQDAPYFIKMMGTKKWCIIERSTAEVKIQMIPTKAEAMQQLDDYMRALAA